MTQKVKTIDIPKYKFPWGDAKNFTIRAEYWLEDIYGGEGEVEALVPFFSKVKVLDYELKKEPLSGFTKKDIEVIEDEILEALNSDDELHEKILAKESQ